MARKRYHRGDRPGRRPRPTPGPIDPPVRPDPRALEAEMRRVIRDVTGEDDDSTPLAQALDLLEEAYDEPSPARRLALARQALAICPDCADAYGLLAEHAPTRRQALAFREQAVAAGERALGPEFFREHAGRFWGMLPTRPYMRARLDLALALWTAGRRDEAVAHLQEMLRLNPHDNQGVRYTLAAYYLFLDRDDDLAALLEQFAEDSLASFAYTRALLAFRRDGDTPRSRELLQHALRTNQHVPGYLLGRKEPPANDPEGYTPGADSEAVFYARDFLSAWVESAGAIAWLRANDPHTQKRKADIQPPRGPLGFVKAWLKRHLPVEPDVWQADVRPLANATRIAGDVVRLWLVLVVSRTTDLVLGHEVLEEEPGAAGLWDVLVKAMQYPIAGEPHRPCEVQARHDERWESLRPHLAELDVGLVNTDPEHLDDLFAELNERLAGQPRPGLLQTPNVRVEQVAGYYEAAAEFFRQKPWKKVGYESAIEVKCARFHSGPWYAVLMGQSGLARGLALYEDLETPQRMWREHGGDEADAWESVTTSVIYGEEQEMPLADLEAARRHGWPVARPDAWPDVMHKERGAAFRRPLGWELELLEGCLRAIPEFLRRRRQEDPTPEELTVPTSAGEMKLVLSWVPEEEAGQAT